MPAEQTTTPGTPVDQLAVLEAENEKLRALLAEYEGAITWGTSCLSCASVLDASYLQWVRADKSERAAAVWKSNWEQAEEQGAALSADLRAVKVKLDAVRDLAMRFGVVDSREILSALAAKPKVERGPSARDLTTNTSGGDCVITGPQHHEGNRGLVLPHPRGRLGVGRQSWWCPTGLGHRCAPSAADCPPELRRDRPEGL